MSIRPGLYVGNCLSLMAEMEPNSFDAIVCDPPYELGFMGRAWDSSGVAFRPETWAAALRVAKPGAHLVAFGCTRTYHRLVCAIEDAGWEIRDCLQWLYGSGFPKSLDVSKAIDKRRTEDLEPTRVVCRYLRAAIDAAGMSNAEIAAPFNLSGSIVNHWAARDTYSQPFVPTLEQWGRLRELIPGLGGDVDALVETLNARKGSLGAAYHERPVTDVVEFGASSRFGRANGTHIESTAASEHARQWEGWGTALKPAWEPIVLARKPFPRTLVANVLAHGTGAIHIDACRIAGAQGDGVWGTSNATVRDDRKFNASPAGAAYRSQKHDGGRWPANVILDEVAGAMLDAQTGELRSGFMAAGTEREGAGYNGNLGDVVAHDTIGDAGGASRFFYCPKASRAERDAGLGAEFPKGNHHPTVKPIALMRWLVRLVTPPGGAVLDPFAGSFSTVCGAILEGFNRVVGFDLDPEHVAIGNARLAHWRRVAEQERAERERERAQLDLLAT